MDNWETGDFTEVNHGISQEMREAILKCSVERERPLLMRIQALKKKNKELQDQCDEYRRKISKLECGMYHESGRGSQF